MDNERRLVMGHGSIKSQIMIIGEAPGANEDRLGEPFVGKAGQILNEALAKAGVPRPAVYVTNIYKHRPPDNRPPTLAEMKSHEPYLWDEFEQVRPKHVLLVGNTSLKFFTGHANIGQKHGTRIFPFKDLHPEVMPILTGQDWESIYFFATYHPMATQYNRNTRKDFFDDVRRFFEVARS